MIKKKSVYTLIKKDVPIIKGKYIISDARVGGEKLIYKRVSYPVRIWNIFNLFKVVIPLILCRKRNGRIGIDIEISTIVYLRPYKKNWSIRKDRLPFHLWGKKERPLTNMWIELEYDFQDIISQIPLMKTLVEDHSLIKLLRQHEEKFILIN